MTDSNGMFAAQDAYGAEGDGSRDKRTILLAGGLAALVLGAGAFFLLGSGSSDDGVSAAPTSSAAAANTKARAAAAKVAAAKPVAAKAKPATVPANVTVDVGRNPFTALYVVPVASVGGVKAPAKTPVTPTTVTAPTTTTPTSVTRVAPSVPIPTTTVARPVTETKRIWIQMAASSVATQQLAAKNGSWSFDVGSGPTAKDRKSYRVLPGDVFGTYFKLIRLDYQASAARYCAQLAYGESVFNMCAADSSYKLLSTAG